MMNPIKKVVQWANDPARFFNGMLLKLSPIISDKMFIRCMARVHCGYWPNLRSPKTFSEKILWLKLYNRRPEYTMMVDKYAVKDYVSSIIGSKYVIPTIGVWDRVEDIDWDALPNQFVLKTTHGGGNVGVVVCKDKTIFDKSDAINKLNKSLKQDLYKTLKEWPYKNVPRRILAEQYIEPKPHSTNLPDYKWFCFDGEPKYCQVIQNRSSDETIDFFDTEWNHQDFVGLNPAAGPAAVLPERPVNMDMQIHIARELSKGIPFSRIDLYETDGNIFFGEITFYPGSGFGVFRPDHYNELLGEMLKLPRIHRK